MGPYADTRVHVRTQKSEETVDDVVVSLRPSGIPTQQVKLRMLRSYAPAYTEELPYLRLFVHHRLANAGKTR